ncbi:MAG: hypothetical protein OXG62_15695 [Nitrospinae bacterium]|nr:hypothetical protein [Nitrospinota bacterium]
MGPQVVYLDESGGESECLESLRTGRIDAVASEELGNRRAAHGSGGAFVVMALDTRIEHGGLALNAADASLAACLDRKIEWLTENRLCRVAEGSFRVRASRPGVAAGNGAPGAGTITMTLALWRSRKTDKEWRIHS